MDAVVADFQIGDAGALAFAFLQVAQPAGGVGGEIFQTVQLGVVAQREHAAIADSRRRLGNQGCGQQRTFVIERGQLAKALRQVFVGQFVHRTVQSRKGFKRLPKAPEIAWRSVAERQAAGDAFQIADGGKQRR